MDAEVNETTYISIIKAVYLFLDNNNLLDTAQCFIGEIKKKFNDVNISAAPVRTVVLRPMERSYNEDECECDDIIIGISTKQTVNIDIVEEKCRCHRGSATGCLEYSTEKDIDELKKTLTKLQEEHINLIQIATQLTTAMNAIEKTQSLQKIDSSFLMNMVGTTPGYFYQADKDIKQDPRAREKGDSERTDDQIESDVINSSQNSNADHSERISNPDHFENSNMSENVIPLEMKKVTNDIPSVMEEEKYKWAMVPVQDQCRVNCKIDYPETVSNTTTERDDSPMDLSMAQTYTGERRFSNNRASDDLSFVGPPKQMVCTDQHKCTGTKQGNPDAQNNLLKLYMSSTFFELDFDKIKRDLLNGDVDIKLKLLQALRWRLTQTSTEIRDNNLANYIKNNILQLKTGSSESLLQSYFTPPGMSTPHPLQEEMSRFINTLASLSLGRDYLQRDEAFFETVLVPILMGKKPNVKVFDLTREFMIAAVQKMSLAYKMRKLIIAVGTVEWLISFMLRNHNSMTNYEAEYSSALLMNLCINQGTLKICEKVADKAAALLCELASTPHSCCLPYLPGIFFTLLSSPTICAKARACKVFERLKLLLEITENEYRAQFQIIIDMYLDSDYNSLCSCDPNEECTYYADIMEPELDMHDPIFGDPSGEKLLELYKKSGSSIGSKQQAQVLRKSCVCLSRSKALIQDHSAENFKVPDNSDALECIEEEMKTLDYESSDKLIVATPANSPIRKAVQSNNSKSTKKSIEYKNRNELLLKETKLSNYKSPEKSGRATSAPVQLNKSEQALKKKCNHQNTQCCGANNLMCHNGIRKVSIGTQNFPPINAKVQCQIISKVDEGAQCRPQPTKDSDDQPVVLPCRLNYYSYNRLNSNPTEESLASKYSCQCYESIRTLIDQMEAQDSMPVQQTNSTPDKPSNVVYGPFKPKLFCTCTTDTRQMYDSDGFETKPKINRTP